LPGGRVERAGAGAEEGTAEAEAAWAAAAAAAITGWGAAYSKELSPNETQAAITLVADTPGPGRLEVQVGLNYICATAERFFAVGAVLGNMVVAQAQMVDQPSQRLLKHIIRCYLRLSDNPRAREALRSCLPELLRNSQFTACLKNDETTRRWLAQLLINVGFPDAAAALGALDVVQPTPMTGA
ncbi:Cell differentiation protein rcd1, partial [Tetrabaena socialis]